MNSNNKSGALVVLVTMCLVTASVFATLAIRLLVQHAGWDTATVGLVGLGGTLLGLLSPSPHASMLNESALSGVLSSVADSGVTATVEPTPVVPAQATVTAP